MPTPEMMPHLPSGLDPKKYKVNPDGSVSFNGRGGQDGVDRPLTFSASYFMPGANGRSQFDVDMATWGAPNIGNGTYQGVVSNFQAVPTDPAPDLGWDVQTNAPKVADTAVYLGDDRLGNPVYRNIPWEERAMFKQAPKDLPARYDMGGKKLGQDVLSSVLSNGNWMPEGSNVSGSNRVAQAKLVDGPNGTKEIMVLDPTGGDGNNSNFYYDLDGNLTHTEKGAKIMSPAMGLALVAGSALGFGALGGLTGGGAAAAGSGAVGSGAGFVGEGALSGIGAWDGALAASPGWTAAGGFGGAGSGAFLGEGAASGVPAWDGALAGAADPLAGSGAFLGENMASGVPAWDTAATNAGLTLGTPSAALPAAGGGGGSALEGVPPPANPNVGGGGLMDKLTNLGAKDLLGIGSTILGAASGASGGGGAGGGGGGSTLDPRLEPFLYGAGGLMPQTQSLLNSQMPQAQQQSAQMAQVGSGLLGQPIAGNGYGTVGTNVAGNGFNSGAVQLGKPDTATNPYLQSQLMGLQDQTLQTLGKSFNQIRGNSVGVGGVGGSRQGVAEAEAMKGAADSLQRAQSGLMYQAYDSDMNRSLQKYGMDQNFYGQQRGQDLTKSAQDQSFYTSQRGQDQTGASLGGSLLGASQSQAWAPLLNASSIYKPYSGFGNASSGGDSGTNWQGLLGGAIQGATFGHSMGWW